MPLNNPFAEEKSANRFADLVTEPAATPPPESHHHRFGLLVVLGIVVVVCAVGAYRFTRPERSVAPALSVSSSTPTSTSPVDDSAAPANNVQPSVGSRSKVEPGLDTDRDGVEDVVEFEYGTDITRPDTDGDGLFDREEMKVYGTDPRVADTDGDGISDGAEIRANQNPKGSGAFRPNPS